MNLETNLFFVYGTLKLGYGNNRVFGDSEFQTTAKSVDNYKLTGGSGIPFAIKHEDGFPVLGEVFKVTCERTLQGLDSLEGNGRFYTRSVREFIDDQGEKIKAWIYEIPKESHYLQAPLCNFDKEAQAYYWSR